MKNKLKKHYLGLKVNHVFNNAAMAATHGYSFGLMPEMFKIQPIKQKLEV